MKNLVFLIISLLTFFSCQNLETKRKQNILQSNNQLDSVQFYSIFRLTKNTTAIVIPIDNTTDSKYSSIFDKFYHQDSLHQFISKERLTKDRAKFYYDTLNGFLLLHDIQLENELKKIVPTEFYINGLKRILKSDITNIIINISECETNFIGFVLKNEPLLNNGKTIFASTKKIELEYINNKAIDNQINQFISTQKYDYRDSIRVKTFAKSNDLYFTYLDDFRWYDSKNNSNCLFPSRMIYKINKNKISLFWGSGIDRFGIGCD